MKKYLYGTWDEFEQWIRLTIRSDFNWKVKPINRLRSRQMVAEDILNSLDSNGGVFPEDNSFIEIRK